LPKLQEISLESPSSAKLPWRNKSWSVMSWTHRSADLRPTIPYTYN
jgi:hypothetical protein